MRIGYVTKCTLFSVIFSFFLSCLCFVSVCLFFFSFTFWFAVIFGVCSLWTRSNESGSQIFASAEACLFYVWWYRKKFLTTQWIMDTEFVFYWSGKSCGSLNFETKLRTRLPIQSVDLFNKKRQLNTASSAKSNSIDCTFFWLSVADAWFAWWYILRLKTGISYQRNLIYQPIQPVLSFWWRGEITFSRLSNHESQKKKKPMKCTRIILRGLSGLIF